MIRERIGFDLSAKPMADALAPVKVLVVEDSAVVRGLIVRGIESDPQIRVVGAAADGQAALSQMERISPDVVLLDIEMPVMDGMEALPKILQARPGVSVIMASALTPRHAGLSFRALQSGAADYVPKPEGWSGGDALPNFFAELKAKIKAHGRKGRRIGSSSPAAAPPIKKLKPRAIAIGSSTGGPPALLSIFEQARGAIRTPVFITQHMPATFTALLAAQLGRVSGAPALEAADGMPVEPGRIYVAPGGRHMLTTKQDGNVMLRLSDAEPENFCKPAVDPMLRSLASVYGAGLLAVILTGMGKDGADGCIAVANSGGHFLVQDEASSVVWGMPGAAFRTGRAMGQLSLEQTGAYLRDVMAGGA